MRHDPTLNKAEWYMCQGVEYKAKVSGELLPFNK